MGTLSVSETSTRKFGGQLAFYLRGVTFMLIRIHLACDEEDIELDDWSMKKAAALAITFSPPGVVLVGTEKVKWHRNRRSKFFTCTTTNTRANFRDNRLF